MKRITVAVLSRVFFNSISPLYFPSMQALRQAILEFSDTRLSGYRRKLSTLAFDGSFFISKFFKKKSTSSVGICEMEINDVERCQVKHSDKFSKAFENIKI